MVKPSGSYTSRSFVGFTDLGSMHSDVLIQEGTDSRREAAFCILCRHGPPFDRYHQRNRRFLRINAAGQGVNPGQRGYGFGVVVPHIGRKITRKTYAALVILTKNHIKFLF